MAQEDKGQKMKCDPRYFGRCMAENERRSVAHDFFWHYFAEGIIQGMSQKVLGFTLQGRTTRHDPGGFGRYVAGDERQGMTKAVLGVTL